jgi:hypothetical protein
MSGNVQNAAPTGVMPYSLCLAFSESREYAQLQAQYHDGTVERSQLAQPPVGRFAAAIQGTKKDQYPNQPGSARHDWRSSLKPIG